MQLARDAIVANQGGPAAPWSPLDLGAQLYHLYWDAGIVGTTNPTAWNDSSGNGRHCGTVNGAPTIVQPNARKGVTFVKGSSEYILRAGTETVPNDAAGGIFWIGSLVFDANEAQAQAPGGWGLSSAGTRLVTLYLDPATGSQLRISCTDAATHFARTNGGANQIIPPTVYACLGYSDGSAYVLYQNGVLQGSLVTGGTQGFWHEDFGTRCNRFALGALPSSATPNTHWDGTLFLWGAWSGTLSAGNLTNLLTFLNTYRSQC